MLAMKLTELLGLYKVTYPIEKGEIVDLLSLKRLLIMLFTHYGLIPVRAIYWYVTNPFFID